MNHLCRALCRSYRFRLFLLYLHPHLSPRADADAGAGADYDYAPPAGVPILIGNGYGTGPPRVLYAVRGSTMTDFWILIFRRCPTPIGVRVHSILCPQQKAHLACNGLSFGFGEGEGFAFGTATWVGVGLDPFPFHYWSLRILIASYHRCSCTDCGSKHCNSSWHASRLCGNRPYSCLEHYYATKHRKFVVLQHRTR